MPDTRNDESPRFYLSGRQYTQELRLIVEGPYGHGPWAGKCVSSLWHNSILLGWAVDSDPGTARRLLETQKQEFIPAGGAG
jgi:hypothetical protein